MSAAEEAYKAAEAAIAQAKREGATSLSLDTKPFRALETLPPEIAGLSGLETLNLDNTQVSDLAPLGGLTGLQTLRLDRTQVSDVAPLAGMAGLLSLGLPETLVSDLAPLAGMTEMQALSLDKTRVSDLTSLAGMTKLQRLWLGSTQVRDLAPLARMIGLQRLDLVHTPVLDLRPLRGLLKLAEDPVSDGLTYRGTLAAKLDEDIYAAAELGNPKARATALFALLEAGWVPPRQSFAFLSYAGVNRPQIAPLRQFLLEQGIKVWWDQDIQGGAVWRNVIAEQLQKAGAVVTFWTAESVMSLPVQEETGTAQSDGRLLQVKLKDVRPPFGFKETQIMNLQGWDGSGSHPEMNKLLQALHDKLERPL